MGDLIASTKKLPAHLAALAVQEDWSSGTTGGFPVISTKGKVFHIKRGDELELVTNDDDEPVSSLQVVVLKTHQGVAKTYYEKTYVEGSDDKPTCYSTNGVEPAMDAEQRQAKKCAICPHNQWGSRITEDGNKAKKCSDVKRLAVAPGGQVNDPMLIRVPPTSLKAWDSYCSMLAKKGLSPAHVITKISFDPNVAHQLLIFKPVGFITEDMVPLLEEALRDPLLDSIIGTAEGPRDEAIHAEAEEESEAEEEPAPKPKAKPKRKAKPKPKVEPEPEPDEEEEPDEGEDDDDDLDELDFGDLDFGDDD